MLVQEKALSEQKIRFVAIVSHEFRTPLTTIQLSVDLVRIYLTNQVLSTLPKILRQLTTIEEQVVKFTDLLADVMILGQLDAGRLLFSPLLYDAEAFTRDLIETLPAN